MVGGLLTNFFLFISTFIHLFHWQIYADPLDLVEILKPKADFPCYTLSGENYMCSACLQLHPSCAWCSEVVFGNQAEHIHCDSYERLLEHECPKDKIVFPQTTWNVIDNQPLSNAGEKTTEEEAVQLRPQKMVVNIRPKARVRFNITYRQAVDYPVDLYYLMDLSYSMKDDKEQLSKLGDTLAATMKNITKNFRLGFGSFVEKKLIPFVDVRKDRLENPCKPEKCEPTYGFKNQMSLTQDTDNFSDRVEKANISGNLDAPEGGFDAVVQALACNESIGWRNRARKMVVFSTDAGFHYAGDGRLAGIVEPNDGQCHLDNDGYYTKSTEQDYPSIALLHQKVKERKANLIFAVTEANKDLYTRLSQALPDVSSSVGVLAGDSGNIVSLIAEEYNKISQKIIMVDNANVSQGIRLSYRSMCLSGQTLKETNVCDGIKVGDEVTFEVTLEVTQCVNQRNFEIKIGPSGLDEVFSVDVHVEGDCGCENQGMEKNAEVCNGKGDLICGVCSCLDGHNGRHCECGRGTSTVALDAKCKRTNESAICEGRGVCNCGVCECFQKNNEERISGKYCECGNFNCPRYNRKICAGHGECNCGKCTCDEDWTGRACQCPVSQENCIASNGKICNGQGECICGKCNCFRNETGRRYSGLKCETCPTCQTKCVVTKPCVMCQQWKTGPYNETQCAECSFKVIPVKELPVVKDSVGCQFFDYSDNCTFYYLYQFDERADNLTVWVKEDKECRTLVRVLAIVLGVVGGIVVVGLILLIVWKILTVCHDRAEVAKFDNERLMAKWDTNENPIYKQAITTFKNPVYSGNAANKKMKLK